MLELQTTQGNLTLAVLELPRQPYSCIMCLYVIDFSFIRARAGNLIKVVSVVEHLHKA